MSLILDMVAPELRADFLSDIRHPTAWLTDMFRGRETAAGVRMSPDKALTISAYFAGVRAISEDLAKLPFITYRRLEPRGKERALTHPNFSLLRFTPNDDMTAMTFRETLTQWGLTWGNGYALIRRQQNRPDRPVVALDPIHPSWVTIEVDADLGLVYDVTIPGNTTLNPDGRNLANRFLPGQIFHLKGIGDGIRGYSIAELAAESLGLTYAAQQFGAEFFGNGSAVGDILIHPGRLDDDGYENLKKSWRESRQANKLGTAILEEGMTWQRVGIPPNDAQFLETREFQVDEVARWLRIPLHKIQKLADATFSNIEAQSIEYVADTLMPWFTRWEQEAQRKLFNLPQDADFFVEHLERGLLRGDSAARAAYYRERFFLGSLSPNDIRELENENPIDDPAADLYYLQASMAPLGTIAEPDPEPAAVSGVAFPSNGATAPV